MSLWKTEQKYHMYSISTLAVALYRSCQSDIYFVSLVTLLSDRKLMKASLLLEHLNVYKIWIQEYHDELRKPQLWYSSSFLAE